MLILFGFWLEKLNVSAANRHLVAGPVGWEVDKWFRQLLHDGFPVVLLVLVSNSTNLWSTTPSRRTTGTGTGTGRGTRSGSAGVGVVGSVAAGYLRGCVRVCLSPSPPLPPAACSAAVNGTVAASSHPHPMGSSDTNQHYPR
jgi:hypothetical protein